MQKDKCKRCGHEWYRRKPEAPRVCPGYKSPYWDKERKAKREKRMEEL